MKVIIPIVLILFSLQFTTAQVKAVRLNPQAILENLPDYNTRIQQYEKYQDSVKNVYDNSAAIQKLIKDIENAKEDDDLSMERAYEANIKLRDYQEAVQYNAQKRYYEIFPENDQMISIVKTLMTNEAFDMIFFYNEKGVTNVDFLSNEERNKINAEINECTDIPDTLKGDAHNKELLRQINICRDKLYNQYLDASTEISERVFNELVKQ